MPYENKIYGLVIMELRKERRMSQEVLSGLAGIARSHLSMIETGNKKANVETLYRIAGALGLKLSEFFSLAEQKEAEMRMVMTRDKIQWSGI